MTGWTVERLDALPVDTTLAVLWEGGAEERFVAEEDSDGTMVWAGTSGNYESSDSLIRTARAIRVVAAPVEALLGFPAFADDLLSNSDPWIRDAIPQVAKYIICAAIAHVTGEA